MSLLAVAQGLLSYPIVYGVEPVTELSTPAQVAVSLLAVIGFYLAVPSFGDSWVETPQGVRDAAKTAWARIRTRESAEMSTMGISGAVSEVKSEQPNDFSVAPLVHSGAPNGAQRTARQRCPQARPPAEPAP